MDESTSFAPLHQLISEFSALPGIGKKSARRLAYHLLTQPPEKTRKLAESLLDARERVKQCEVCYAFTEKSPCPVCSSPTRDQQIICVVEKAADQASFENSGVYKGTYHVLGGCLSPLDGVGPGDLHIPELVQRVKQHDAKEVILAMGSSADAEATALYIDRLLQDHSVKRTRLARGIPMGSDLEFVDELTVLRAFEARTGI